MAVFTFEPIAAKLRGLVPLSKLLPANQVAVTRQRILDGEKPGEAPMQTESLEFLAEYMTVTQAAAALMSLPPFRAVADQYERLEDEFQSGGPPMSPIYDSYSMMHALVEIPVGVASETPMGVLARLTASSAAHRVLHDLAADLAKSHLDIYRATEVHGTTVTLVHVRSGQALKVLLTGPFLRNSDLFLGRVVRSSSGQHFIAESPYLLYTEESEYLDYLERKVPAAAPQASKDKAQFKGPRQKGRSKAGGGNDNREARVRRFLRQGESARYWPEFIFNAYAGERNAIVALVGVPDRPQTQPQHDQFDESSFVPDRVALAETVPPLERLRLKLDKLVEVNHVWESHAAVIAAHVAPLRLDLNDPRYKTLYRAFCCYGAPDEQGRSLLSVCVASGKLSKEEQSVAAALERGWFSLFEVRRIHLDESLEVFDLLRRKRLTILEKSATRGVALMDVLAGWILIEENGDCRLEGGWLQLKAPVAQAVVDIAKSARKATRSPFRDIESTKRLGLLVPEVISVTHRLEHELSGASDGKAARHPQLSQTAEAEVQSLVLATLRAGLDQPIPMLNHRTLRELAKSKETAPDAIAWLREQERILGALGTQHRLDLRPIWQELELPYQGLETDPTG